MSQFDDNNTDGILNEITENLSKQVVEELEEVQEKNVSIQVKDEKKKQRKNVKKILIGVGSVLAMLIIGVVLAGNYFLGRINYEDEPEIEFAEEPVIEKGEEDVDAKEIVPVDTRVINILLIGDDKTEKDGERGRSDSTMIATINQKQKSLKITSVMRDCYVDIPGYGKRKLNAAYGNGGGSLLASTIEQNFEIPIDGYVMVDFAAFEAIVDKLGGVDIELTEVEAGYLRIMDYISDPSQRTVAAGMNHMTGNQALGYARVRHKTAGNGEQNDFGRTYRQRVVLSTVFEKCKSKNLVELIAIINDLLPYITTNLSKTEILGYAAATAGTGMSELETFRVPMDNAYSNADVKIGNASKTSEVLMVDFEKNNAALKEFIYGAVEDETAENNSSQELSE